MGYQLFSALAGTLADANTDGSSRAVLLVMEYFTDLTDDAEHAQNARVLDNFATRLLGSAEDRTELSDGWITAPRSVRGDGAWSARSTEVSLAKLARNRRTGS